MSLFLQREIFGASSDELNRSGFNLNALPFSGGGDNFADNFNCGTGSSGKNVIFESLKLSSSNYLNIGQAASIVNF